MGPIYLCRLSGGPVRVCLRHAPVSALRQASLRGQRDSDRGGELAGQPPRAGKARTKISRRFPS